MIKEEVQRPFSIMLVVGNLEKKETDKILKDLAHLDIKAYKNGDLLKITLPLRTAITVTVEQFAGTLFDTTHRAIYGSQEEGMLYFKFGDEIFTEEDGKGKTDK